MRPNLLNTYKFGLNNDYTVNNTLKFGLNNDYSINNYGKFGLNNNELFISDLNNLNNNSNINVKKWNLHGVDNGNISSKLNNFSNTLNNTSNILNNFKNSQKLSGLTSKMGGFAGKASGIFGIAEAGITGFKNGINNLDKGKHNTVINSLKNEEQAANNVSKSYNANSDLNLLTRTSSINNSANSLKSNKGFKNILTSTGKGALAGAQQGGVWGAAIGGAVGLIGSGLGEILGGKKRKKAIEEEKELKKQADYAVDYYNNKQLEQLESAKEQNIKNIADQNRVSVLSLMAYGGKRNILNKKKYVKII